MLASLAAGLLMMTRRGKRDNFSGLAEALGWSGVVMSDRIAELAGTMPCSRPCRARGFCTPGRAKYNRGMCCKGPWASRGFCSGP